MSSAGAQSEMYGGTRMSPPPDLPSLMLNNRIVYVGMPISASVAELIVAELLWLQYESESKPCFMYINSPGLITEARQLVGIDTEGFAIVDTMGYVKAPMSTICVGKAYGMAALMLASGDRGKRGAMPYATMMLQQSMGQAQGQASDIKISALEMMYTRQQMMQMMAERTGKAVETILKDSSRQFYLDAQQAVDYGIIDKILQKDQLPLTGSVPELSTLRR
ncbi:ClpP/crotonase-like domain-containing protein [Pavlovales sp. CCMP2436]|nr:ClpP/crotonase-like domain-containing protein [Pavlovales sp. CCMP2436]